MTDYGMARQPVPAMTRAPLVGTDLYDWIALRRVSDGGIARMGDCWFDGGRRVPCYVTDTLAGQCEAGLVTLADPDEWGLARAALTGTGTTRYEQLCRQRQRVGIADDNGYGRWS